MTTGVAELAEVDGPFVKIRLKGRFWHERSLILARLGNYLKERIPVRLYDFGKLLVKPMVYLMVKMFNRRYWRWISKMRSNWTTALKTFKVLYLRFMNIAIHNVVACRIQLISN